MPITIVCSSCGSKLKAPSKLAGQKTKCPKCGATVTVSAAASVTPTAGFNAPPVARDWKEAPPPVAASKPPAPVPVAAVRPSAFSNSQEGEEEDGPAASWPRSDTSTRGGAAHSLGIGSMVLGIVALLFSFIPCIGVFSMPLSGLGLILGIIGGIVALCRSGRGIGFPIAGSAINGMALVIALFWLVLARGARDALDKTSTSLDQSIRESPGRSQGGKLPKAESPRRIEWSEIGSTFESGDLCISIGPTRVQTITGEKFGRFYERSCLCLKLAVENKTTTKLIRWRGWQGEGEAEDEFGNKYKGHLPSFNFEAPRFFPVDIDNNRLEGKKWWGDSGGRIGPGKVYMAILYLEPPIEAATEIRLSLPASVFQENSKETIRFRVPIE